jgi:membrane protein
VLPARVRPRDAAQLGSEVGGALFTAVLFTLGKFLIGLYIAKTGAGDAYGAGGVIVIVMLWAYFSTLILLFGAQYTYVSSGAAAKRVVQK